MKEIWSHLILKTQSPCLVTLIGGGGKTSLMYYLLTILKSKGYTTIGTSTTKLSSQRFKDSSFLTIQSVEGGYQAVTQAKSMPDHVTLVSGEDPDNPGKMLGISSEWIDILALAYGDVVLVVEGDGAAGKPLKGHLAHEPVIPSKSSLVIVVIGIDSMGLPLTSQNVHRPARICELTAARPDSLVTTEMITQLLFHPQGYLHNCPPHSVVVPFINKVESVAQGEMAKKLATQILASHHPQVSGVMIGSLLTEEGLWLQG